MSSQRTLLGLVLGLTAVLAASAQTSGTLRWRAGVAPLGLQAGNSDFRLPCGNITFPCDGGSTTVRLYTSNAAPRSLSMQLGALEGASPLPWARPQGLSVSVIGRTGVAPDLGVYGRIGTTVMRAAPASPGVSLGDSGLTYGVGLSWDFSRRGSAVVGWDSYDLRTAAGEARDVRATSLGLQWRY